MMAENLFSLSKQPAVPTECAGARATQRVGLQIGLSQLYMAVQIPGISARPAIRAAINKDWVGKS